MSGSPVLLFDGRCGLCDRWVQFVLRHDRAQVFRFAALQTEAGQKLLQAHGLTGELDSMVLVAGDRAFIRSSAALETLRLLGPWWGWVGVFRLVPRAVRDRVYDFVARHRHRVWPAPDRCRVIPPADRARFLEL